MIQSAVAIAVQVVLDQDHGVADGHESMQLSQEQCDVLGVQARSRLVEQVERMAAAGPLQLGCQLDALGFAATELSCGLS